MKKSEYRAFARSALEEWDLGEYDIVFNGRMKRAIGKHKPAEKRIDLSKLYFVDSESEIDTGVLKDVILHEVAHALDYERRGTSGHDRPWKRAARDVGADPTRMEEGIPKSVKAAAASWKRECPQCGKCGYYFSKPTSKKTYLCPDCHVKSHSRAEKLEYALEVKRA